MPMESPPNPPNPETVLAVIPARWGSTRFPGKPLVDLAGKALVQHVWERCRECRRLDAICVATDDDRIAEAARGFGADVVMTRSDHPSGTDRVAEAARSWPEAGVVLNVQGDEPLISPKLIDALAAELMNDPGLAMVTAANAMGAGDDFEDPNVVKVVRDAAGDALYFSRSPIPYRRNPEGVKDYPLLRHKGIYGYRRDFLEAFVSWPPSVLEQIEGLEQLRALDRGARLRVVLTEDESPGVDTPEQARIVAGLIRRR